MARSGGFTGKMDKSKISKVLHKMKLIPALFYNVEKIQIKSKT